MNEGRIAVRAVNLDIALAVFSAVGVTTGVLISLGMDDATLTALSGVSQKLELAASGDWFRVFLSSFAGVGVLLAAAFLCGFCAVSQPLELILAAFRGLGLGICIRGVYLADGIFRSMAVFLPFAVLSTAILILGIREAFRLSMRYLSLSTTAENRLGLRNEIHDYTARFLIYAIMLAALSMADAYFVRLISGI